MINRIKKNIFITLAIAAVLYLGFSVYADMDSVRSAFMNFRWQIIPLILGFIFLNYLVRFFKWDYYLHILKIKVRKRDSFSIFMSGLIMSVTPGKMGELMKSYLVKQVASEPISRTAPVIFAERVTDFLSLVLLSLSGAYIYDYGREIVLGTGIFFIAVILIISSRTLTERIIAFSGRSKFLRKYAGRIESAYESSYQLLRPLPLLFMTLVSIVSWSFECFSYYLIIANFNLNVSFMFAAFVYAFSTIAGAVSMLPGGLGVTDGSLTYLLIQKGIPSNIAVSSTFIIRVATLWFAVLIGIISVSIYQKTYGEIKNGSEN